jgi:[CysO sulfur-carrier protein]-S-L-cysteine hydrolase
VPDITIAAPVLAGIVEHARDEAPIECCGLLAGAGAGIDEVIRTRNIKGSRVAYQIDPAEHLAAMKRLRLRGRHILGAYHSHPRTPALPSATDLAEAYYTEDFLYVIVSLAKEEPDVRAYRLREGALIPVSIRPV